MRVVVTGGSGLAGRWAIYELLTHGYEVVNADLVVGKDVGASFVRTDLRDYGQVLASLDPVALDYWASKHLLYPIDGNEEHNPDEYLPLRSYLAQVRDMVNAEGGLSGREITLDESLIDVISSVIE